MPKKIRNLDSAFRLCTDGFFTGYDPPKALIPATAMSPVTSSDPVASLVVATPGLTQDPGPSSTTAVSSDHESSISEAPSSSVAPAPAKTQHVSQPQSRLSLDPVPDSRHSGHGMDPNPVHDTPKFGNSEGPFSTSKSKPGGGFQGVTTSEQQVERLGGFRTVGQEQPNGTPLGISEDEITAPSRDPKFPEKTIVVAGQTLQLSHSNAQVEASGVDFDRGSSTLSGSNMGRSGTSTGLVIDVQTIHMSSELLEPTTTLEGIEGHILAESSLVLDSINGIPEATLATTLGTQVSVDPSNHVGIAQSSHQPPSTSPILTTSLPHAGLASPALKGLSVYGTTVVAGAPPVTISGKAISFDASNNLIVGASTLVITSISPLAPELPVVAQVTATATQSSGSLPKGISTGGETVTPGGQVISVDGIAVSVEADNDLIVGSEIIKVQETSATLANPATGTSEVQIAIATSSTLGSQGNRSAGAGSDENSNNHTAKGSANRLEMCMWQMLMILVLVMLVISWV